MADPAAEEANQDRFRKAHDCCLMMAKAAWAVICFAHGDESPFTQVEPFREFWLGGEIRPMPDQSIALRPAVLAAAVVGLQETIRQCTELEDPDFSQMPLVTDGMSLHDGAGGVFDSTWHTVAWRLFDGVCAVVNRAIPLSKIPVGLGGTYVKRYPGSRSADEWAAIVEHHKGLPEEWKETGFIITPATLERLYPAIRRKFKTTFSIEQLLARLIDEFERGQSTSVERPPNAPEGADIAKETRKPMPDSADVRDLCALIAKQFGKKSLNAIAREFTRGNEAKATSLLRQARRFRHLWEP